LKTRSQSGFTLIEVLVATVISVSMLTLVMASFWTLWQTYRTAEIMGDMQHEATFALTRVADKIRAKGLDYEAYKIGGDCFATPTSPLQNLCLNDDNNPLTLADNYPYFVFENENLFMGDYAEQDPLFSTRKFMVEALDFSYYPDEEPNRRSEKQYQGQVSIYLKLVSRRDIWGRLIDPAEALSLSLQTTISSRNYDF
jgi:prepilin-type N-terminal cleavage/methylation domain-containing protein